MRVIDAEAVIQKLKELQARCIADGSLLAGATHQIIQWCIDIIMQQPTVETVKTGEWRAFGEFDRRDRFIGYRIVCSNCKGNYFEKSLNNHPFDYCPHCGAMMKRSWNVSENAVGDSERKVK